MTTFFNSEMLTLARESRRMTQKALALASSTTQSAISKAEAGIVQPVAESVAAWSAALRYTPEFFAQRYEGPPLPRTFFRKRASLSQTDTKAIKASIAIQCRHVEALVRSVDIPETDSPALTVEEVGSAAEAARYLRTKWRIPAGPLANLCETIEDHSIVVVPLQTSAESFDGLSVFEQNRAIPPVMFIRSTAPADRIRWTMAHELGHIVLHHHRSTMSEDCEDEADEFASEFLMPANDIRGHFSSRSSIEEFAHLKLHWRVSMASLIRRARSLARISDSHYTRIWKTMSFMGYKRNEPNQFEFEQPTLLSEMIRVHVEELGFTDDNLSTLLAIYREELRSLYKPDSVEVNGTKATSPRLRLVE